MTIDFLRGLLPQEVILYLMIFFGALLIFEGMRQIVGRHAGEIHHIVLYRLARRLPRTLQIVQVREPC